MGPTWRGCPRPAGQLPLRRQQYQVRTLASANRHRLAVEWLLMIAGQLGAATGVLVLGILYGVLAAIGVSVAELLLRIARPHDAIQGIVPGMAGMHDID